MELKTLRFSGTKLFLRVPHGRKSLGTAEFYYNIKLQ